MPRPQTLQTVDDDGWTTIRSRSVRKQQRHPPKSKTKGRSSTLHTPNPKHILHSSHSADVDTAELALQVSDTAGNNNNKSIRHAQATSYRKVLKISKPNKTNFNLARSAPNFVQSAVQEPFVDVSDSRHSLSLLSQITSNLDLLMLQVEQSQHLRAQVLALLDKYRSKLSNSTDVSYEPMLPDHSVTFASQPGDHVPLHDCFENYQALQHMHSHTDSLPFAPAVEEPSASWRPVSALASYNDPFTVWPCLSQTGQLRRVRSTSWSSPYLRFNAVRFLVILVLHHKLCSRPRRASAVSSRSR